MEKTVDFGIYKLQTVEEPSDIAIWTDIEWYLLKELDGRALFLAKDCLSWGFYYGGNTLFEPAKPCSWEESYIRSRLNEELIYEMFTEEERRVILPANKLGDRLFILNEDDINRLLGTEDIRKAEIFFADEIDGRIRVWREPSIWWINTVGSEPNLMLAMGSDGEIDIEVGTSSDEVGVRPAMWVDYYALKRLKGETI